MSAGLNKARVLIVEDEPFIALDIAHAVEKAGGVLVGPAATVAEALDLIGRNGIKAAILDVNLPDGHIGPVLQALKQTAAIVVHTGVGLPPEVRAMFPDVQVYNKPVSPEVLTARLAEKLVKLPDTT